MCGLLRRAASAFPAMVTGRRRNCTFGACSGLQPAGSLGSPKVNLPPQGFNGADYSGRQFLMYEALRKGVTVQALYERTYIKPWFIAAAQEDAHG